MRKVANLSDAAKLSLIFLVSLSRTAGGRGLGGRWCRNNCEAENLVAVCLYCYENDFWGLHRGMSVNLHTGTADAHRRGRECRPGQSMWQQLTVCPGRPKLFLTFGNVSSGRGFKLQVMTTSGRVDGNIHQWGLHEEKVAQVTLGLKPRIPLF